MNGTRPLWTAIAGVLLVLIGFVLLASPVLTTFAAGMAWGALLLMGGIVQVAHAVLAREPDWGFGVVSGVVSAVAGLLLLFDPVDAVVGLTLVLAVYLMAAGALRLLGAAALPFAGARWWLVLSGVVSLLLGVAVAREWPASSPVTLGLFLGADAIAAGVARIGLALAEGAVMMHPPQLPRAR